MASPNVTIIMSPRERFRVMPRSIESLYNDEAGLPFDFICVDGGSPAAVKDYLRAEAPRRGFRLIDKPYYLVPNEARNLGLGDLADIKTPYVVFIDNDVVFTPGWLKWLVDCAEETGAAIVSPLICIGKPLNTIIHMAGGEAYVAVKDGRRVFHETHRFWETPVAEVRDQLVREPIGHAEFHCMLIRTEWLQGKVPLDEDLKAVLDHTDLSMQVRDEGGKLMIEPRAVVTYVTNRLSLDELEYFYCRWSDEWSVGAERRFHEKWNTEFNDRITREFVVYHRRHALPRLRRFVRFFIGWRLSEWLFRRIERAFIWSAKRKCEARPPLPRAGKSAGEQRRAA